jgi:mono/diheme cytochrome c family protein
VARSLCLSSSIAVGVVGAVLLAAAGTRIAQAAETHLVAADAVRGRALFVSKGCIACHAINEVGGTSAPPLDAEAAPGEVDPLDFVARMWRGAEAMIFMQQQELGEQIDFTGQELADIIAFVHDPEAQKTFSAADVPPAVRRLIRND